MGGDCLVNTLDEVPGDQFILELVDITTGELIWTDQELVRKTKRTGLFGG